MRLMDEAEGEEVLFAMPHCQNKPTQGETTLVFLGKFSDYW
jgi:hypothetical protein